jgi:hypothetical protein
MNPLEIIKNVLPTAATLLAGPFAGIAVKFLAGKLGASEETQDAVTKAITAVAETPEGKLQLAKLDADLKTHLADIGLQESALATEEVEAVNQTMRVELTSSKDEAWYQKAWRPANGFSLALGSFAAVIFTCYLFYRAIAAKDATALTMLPQLAISITAILAVPGAAVGVASWKRGQQKIEELKGL